MSIEALEKSLRAILPDSCLLATPLNLTPEISLYLLDDAYPQHLLSPDQASQLMETPPYWCFCWASGDVLARYLLDNPQLVSGKTVLDLGCGSGVAAIAAAMAGAKKVIACDLDKNALMACKLNIKLNKPGMQANSLQHGGLLNEAVIETLDNFDDLQGKVDTILVADVLYDRDNLPLLGKIEQKAAQVLLADSRVPDFKRPGYRRIGEYESCTWPDLDESASFRFVRLFEYQALY